MCLSKVWENGRLLEKLQIPVCRGHHAEHQDQTGKTQYLMSGSCDYWNKEKENLSFSYIRDQDVNKKWLTHVQRRAREPIWTGQPISARYRMSCSLTVCFGWCQPLPSVFIFSFILPFIIQTLFQAFQVPHLPSFLPRIPFRQLICRHKQEC